MLNWEREYFELDKENQGIFQSIWLKVGKIKVYSKVLD